MSNIPESIKKQIKTKNYNYNHLDLSNLGLNDNDLSEIQELLVENRFINSLDLSNNNITSKGCEILSLISTLKKINLSNCLIGDKGVEALIKSGIDDLDISDCGITNVGAKMLQDNLSKYKALSIIGNPSISEQIINKIRSNFVNSISEYREPIGIDLGLNTHSFYSGSSNFYKKPVEDHENEKKLVNKLIKEHEKEISVLSHEEKENLIIQFGRHLGLTIEVKPNFAPVALEIV